MEPCLDIGQFTESIVKEFGVPANWLESILNKLANEQYLDNADGAVLRAALEYSVEKTRRAFDTSDNVYELFLVLSIGGKFHEMFSLLYNLDELADVIAESLRWMRRNEKVLVETGFATQFSGRCTDFDMLCSRLYYTKIPAQIRAMKKGAGYLVEYGWKQKERIVLNPISLPPDDLTKFLSTSNEKPADFDTAYESGRTINLMLKQSDWIAQRRKKVFDAKVLVLEAIQSALKKHDHSELWNKSIKTLADIFEREEIETLLRLDPTYESISQYEQRTQIREHFLTAHPNGGISELLGLLGYCEMEMRDKSIATLRNSLSDLVKVHPEFGNCLIPTNKMLIDLWMTTYLDMNDDQRKRVDRAFSEYWADTGHHVDFWKSYSKRIDTALESEFSGHYSVKTKGKFKHLIARYVEHLEEMQKIGATPTFSEETVTQRTGITKRSLKRPTIPSGTEWTDITITMTTSEAVKIKIKGHPAKTFLYSDLGFKNENTNSPDRNWILLRQFAKNRGEITPAEGQINDVKKKVSDLRAVLVEIFGLPGDTSIQHSAKDRCYRTTFHTSSEISDDRRPSSPSAMPSGRPKRRHFEDDGAATELEQLIDDQAEDDDS